MKSKHVDAFIQITGTLAALSPCSRRKFGAVLVDPSGRIIASGYNGLPRSGRHGIVDGPLCGGPKCLRDGLASGERTEVGCIHAEANVIANAAGQGACTDGGTLFVGGEPCLNCAKLIIQAGIAAVVVVRGGWVGGLEGVDLLYTYGVAVTRVEGPVDPRSAK